MESLIGILQRLTPDSLNLDEMIRDSFEGIRSSSHSAVAAAHSGEASVESSGISFKFLWGAMMTTILCFFLISCISQFAQFYQTMLNGLESDRLRSLLSTRQLRAMSSGTLRRSPAADLFFSGSPHIGTSPMPLMGSAAKYFAQKMESQKSPKYDLVYLSTSSAGMESEE